jgi:pimeloyl-ACP methyl ester carboxylesterase
VKAAKSIYRTAAGEQKLREAYDRTLAEWNVPIETLYVPTRFGQTHVIAAGPEGAEPLVLLHGFGFSSTHWVDNVGPLSERYRVYALDFVGDLNKSVADWVMETPEECEAWFLDVLAGLGVNRVHLMGLSYGGFLAFLLAGRLPGRTGKLVGISPGATLQKQGKGFFLRCLLAGMFPAADRLNRLMDAMTAPGNRVNPAVREQFITAMQCGIPRIRMFARYMTDEELKRISCPTLLLLGEYELQYDPRRAIDRARRLIPRLQVRLFERAGHGLPMERPDAVNPVILDFLQERLEALPQAQ